MSTTSRAPVLDLPPPVEARRRVPVVLAGLVLLGVGVAVMVRADLGLSPWDVFHQGVSNRIGLPIGTVVIGTGVVILAAFGPLGERIGLGTVVNALVTGLIVDGALGVLGRPGALALRVAFMAAGPVLIATGTALYLGAGLGSGPRDGLMTAIGRRGHPLWAVRTALELTALVVGVALGGSIGLGTVWFAVTIGPMVHALLPRLTFLPPRPPPGPVAPAAQVPDPAP